MKNYFKKFSIMFVMALAIMLGCCTSAFATDDGVVGKNNLNNTAENSAKIGDKLTLPEIGWVRYDDSDSRLLYKGDWRKDNNPNTYKLGHHFSLVPSSFNFKFYGTKLRFIAHKNMQYYSDNVHIRVDGVECGHFSEYVNGETYQLILYTNESLTKDFHNIEVYTTDKGMNLDAIDIYGYLVNTNESITLDKSIMNLIEGDSGQLTAITTPSAVGVKWKSSDDSVASVDQTTGKVTRVIGGKEGTCTITATMDDGSNIFATCTVNVTKKTEPTNPTDNNDGTTNIVNIAHAKGDNTNNAGGDVSIIFKGVAEAQLSVLKTADVESVYVGDTFTYTIVVTNTSTKTAKEVVMDDSAPNHIDFSVSGVTTTQGKVDPSSTSKNIIVNVGDIPPSGTVTIKIPVTVIL